MKKSKALIIAYGNVLSFLIGYLFHEFGHQLFLNMLGIGSHIEITSFGLETVPHPIYPYHWELLDQNFILLCMSGGIFASYCCLPLLAIDKTISLGAIFQFILAIIEPYVVSIGGYGTLEGSIFFPISLVLSLFTWFIVVSLLVVRNEDRYLIIEDDAIEEQ